jgi:hypothetical protein
MRRPSFVFGLVPRVATLISILALAGCGGGGGGTHDGGSGGQIGTGGHVGSGGSGSGGNASGGTGGSVTDSGTDLPKADAGTGGADAGGTAGASGAGGQMDAAMDTANGSGGSGMGGAGGDVDASVDAPADGAGAGGMDASDAGAGGADGGVDGSAPVTSATGVEMISVPLATTGQGQRYNVQNRTNPDVPYNLSGQTLTIRAYAPGGIGGDMSVFFRSSTPVDGAATGAVDSAPIKVGLSTITSGFTDVQITVPAAGGGFDPTMVDIIRIEIEADATFGATFQTPATIVYFDSITSSNGVVMLPFDVAAVGGDFASSGARPLAGSTNPTFLATFP